MREYMSDLYDWEKQMELKEKLKNKSKQDNKKLRELEEQ